MKKRMIPFGYEVKAGNIIIKKSEGEFVKTIFDSYISGQSLRAIAIEMTNNHLEFCEGKTVWNKNMIKRIIEDPRYIGEGGYPQLVDKGVLDKACEIKNKRNLQKDVIPEKVITRFNCYVVCASCGSGVKRIRNAKRDIPEYWLCENPDCKKHINISDQEFLRQTTEILNSLVKNPQSVYHDTLESSSAGSKGYNHESPPEIRQIENEIERMMYGVDVDKEKLKELIYRCAGEKYRLADGNEIVTELLKAEFEKSDPLFSFNRDLLGKVVSEIRLSEGDEIKLVLKNNKVIGRTEEKQDAGESATFGADKANSRNTA